MTSFLEAEASEFHDSNLIEATRQINQIIRRLPVDPEGRTLSLLRTKMGLFLAWVDHGAASLPEGAVTAKDDDATVARAMRLKGYAAAN